MVTGKRCPQEEKLQLVEMLCWVGMLPPPFPFSALRTLRSLKVHISCLDKIARPGVEMLVRPQQSGGIGMYAVVIRMKFKGSFADAAREVEADLMALLQASDALRDMNNPAD
jgi:hypothetical protein